MELRHYEFLLNFNATEGTSGHCVCCTMTTRAGASLTVTAYNEGDDVLFGDLGNDWMVGGTGQDNLYGGYGNDLLNVDDDLTHQCWCQ